MPTPTISPDETRAIAECRKVVAGCTTWLEARGKLAAHLDRHPDTITRLCKRLESNGVPIWEPKAAVVAAGRAGDAFTEDVELSKAATVEEVIALCGVDTDQYEAKGFNVRRGAKGFAWSARFVRKKGTVDVEGMLQAFIERATQHAPSFKSVKPIKTKPTDRLLEIAVPDLHLAKLCWKQETGFRDYDIAIASRLYREAVTSLVQSASAMGVSRILLPIGNDLLNSDNAAGTTTGGTPQAQSEDGRWKKAYMTACDLIVEVIEQLATQYPVDVVVVGGNHDHERSFYLGHYVKGWFHSHPNVTVDNSPTQRKYHRFGTTLIGYTHGHEESPARLPGIMAKERPDLWAATQHHHWHLGHLHREILTEDVGVKIRWLPSLCPADEWMASKGFIGNDQAAEGFVYDPEGGMIATLYFRA